ncbi:pyroglutamyl-peptidase 1 [Bacillus rossius redtenbacheri]|uniref:pyroglutamyl-peptidase 1 n=1 Tax=Bacillus rossius redtenbacheri TaxID=93214 RepID=UPI002FDC973F
MGLKEKMVVVTGFGPFGEHSVNASWEAVKLLPSLALDEELGLRLHVEEVSVAYDAVSSQVPRLWQALEPALVVHVGVSSVATDVVLESCAHRAGYVKQDVCGKVPLDGQCCNGSTEKIISDIDVELISKKVNESNIGVATSVSRNAGRYLCEYIYYTSLCINNLRCIFVHVPPLGKPYSAQELARALKEIIKVIVQNMDQFEGRRCDATCDKNVL